MNIKLITTEKALSPTQITLADYCLNPYRGCEFGCLYCYSNENKNIKGKTDVRELGVKINIEEVLKRQLRFIRPKRVLLGSTTECFQRAELKYRLMEKILKTLNSYGIPFTILTKSHLITQYLGLISQNKQNKIYFTLNCEPVNSLELNSSNQIERLEAIKEIQQHNVNLRIHVGPFIPYLSTIGGIAGIIPSGAKELDIEFYHHKMGNFEKMIKVIGAKFGSELKERISLVYENESNYLSFSDGLKNELRDFKKIFKNISLFYIVPDFNTFYNKNITYENELEID